MKICVVGKGGREHALIRSLKESPSSTEVSCFPGSEAIHEIEGAGKVDAHDLNTLIAWMTAHAIDLCIAGEESYLVTGEGLAISPISDRFVAIREGLISPIWQERMAAMLISLRPRRTVARVMRAAAQEA